MMSTHIRHFEAICERGAQRRAFVRASGHLGGRADGPRFTTDSVIRDGHQPDIQAGHANVRAEQVQSEERALGGPLTNRYLVSIT